MTGCGRWSMMHELGPQALRQLELLIMRAPPALRFVLATRHEVRRRADVQAEQDRRVAGIRLAEAAPQPTLTPLYQSVWPTPWPTASSHAALCAPDGSSR
jgi:hypothetical protein